MMDANILQDYFDKIGYTEQPAPTYNTLSRLHQLHTQQIVFENLNALLSIPVNLEEKELVQKLIYDGRGGYCYEQNLLFAQVLRTVGFDLIGLEARVLLDNSGEPVLPRTHMLLLVQAEGRRYLADVGFGGLTPMCPLLLQPDVVQPTPHESYRLIQSDGSFTLQISIKNKWQLLYRFDLQKQIQSDYEVANWYTSTHPASQFVTNLMLSKKSAHARYTMNNNRYSIYEMGKEPQKYTLHSTGEWQQILIETFGLPLGGLTGLNEKMEEILAREDSGQFG